MNELQRITTQYIEAQDRIQLLGEHTSGAPEMIWLTQRLLTRLLPHALAWLQQQTPVTHVHGALAVQDELLQGFAQQAARAQLPDQALGIKDTHLVDIRLVVTDTGSRLIRLDQHHRRTHMTRPRSSLVSLENSAQEWGQVLQYSIST